MARLNIQKKLIIPMMSAVIILLIIFSVLIIQYLRVLTENRVESKALDEIRIHATSIQGFFETRARIPTTFMRNPSFLDFFSRHRQFRQPVEDNKDYQNIIKYFQGVLKEDSTIKSIFFASDATDEYFDEQGRYEEAGYSAKSRPWWKNCIRQNRLYCDNPSFDYRDSTFSTTMQMPVYDDSRFLGIGGIDILITTVSSEISQIRYENQGNAFLIDENGECIVFPDLNQKIWSFRKLGMLDSLLKDTNGFKELQAMMSLRENGLLHVRYQGLKHVALFTPVGSNSPFFKWRLGLLVPQGLIDNPIRRITVISVFVVSIFILCIFGVTLTIAYSITKPLNALSIRLDEMANQKSDLTIELPAETDDAIGQMARNFNVFVRQIRDLLIRVLDLIGTVAESTTALHEHSGRIANEAKALSDETQRVSQTSNLMLQHVDDIAKGIKRVSQFSAMGKRSSAEGEGLVNSRIDRMESMTGKIADLCGEMGKIREKTETISKTVDIINELNEQVSMLSINASIEAVRAGESGSGFAVLAEEIKTLSERTGQANTQTWTILKVFAQDIRKFDARLLELKEIVEEEFRFTEELKQTFIVLQNDVSLTDQTAEEIKGETFQQSESIRLIIETILQTSETIGHLLKGVSRSFEEIKVVDEKVKDLKRLTDVFKV